MAVVDHQCPGTSAVVVPSSGILGVALEFESGFGYLVLLRMVRLAAHPDSVAVAAVLAHQLVGSVAAVVVVQLRERLIVHSAGVYMLRTVRRIS